MKMPYIVGVTGGIGAGKTTITQHFQRLGADVIDADVIARELVVPGSQVLAQIHAEFGDDMLAANGELNRAALRALIFKDVEAKAKLNAIMHPAVRERLHLALAATTSAYVILSAPLLLENNLDALCQRVLVIDVPESVQIERTQIRDKVDADQVRAIIAAQISRTERLKRADDIIDNTQGMEQVADLVVKLHKNYLDFAKSE